MLPYRDGNHDARFSVEACSHSDRSSKGPRNEERQGRVCKGLFPDQKRKKVEKRRTKKKGNREMDCQGMDILQMVYPGE